LPSDLLTGAGAAVQPITAVATTTREDLPIFWQMTMTLTSSSFFDY